MSDYTIVGKVEYVEGANKKAPIRFFPEASGQSYEEGWLVDLSSGKVAAVTLDGSSYIDKSAGARILGIALADATGSATTTNSVPVQLLPPGSMFRIAVYDTTPAQAITALANVGSPAKVIKVDRTTSYTPRYVYCIDNDAIGTDNDAIVNIVGIDPLDSVGSKYAYYLATVCDGAYRLEQA